MAMKINRNLSDYAVRKQNYSNYTSVYISAANSKKQTAESKAATQTGSVGEEGLSKGVQALLEKLRKSYSNMDFVVVDFDKRDNAKDILSSSPEYMSDSQRIGWYSPSPLTMPFMTPFMRTIMSWYNAESFSNPIPPWCRSLPLFWRDIKRKNKKANIEF